MIGTRYLIAGVAFLALIGGVFAFGYQRGSINEIRKIEQERVATQEELFDLADTVREQTEKLRQLQREKEELVYELENEANTAPGSDNIGISGTGGLQRLERRWGPSPRTAK